MNDDVWCLSWLGGRAIARPGVTLFALIGLLTYGPQLRAGGPLAAPVGGVTAVRRAAAVAAPARSAVARGTVRAAAPAASLPSGSLFMISDYGFPPVVRFFDPVRGRIAYDYELDIQKEERCNESLVACMTLGVEHHVIQGDDVLDVAMFVVNDRKDAPEVAQYSVIQRVRPTRHAELVWKIRTLDWSDIPDRNFYCTSDPDGERTDPGCLLQITHAIKVVNDLPDQKRVTVVAADLDNQRVLQLTLDYNGGNTEAHVDWVLGRTNPDWPNNGDVNGLNYIPDQPGGPYLLTTFYTSVTTHPASGRLIMWQWDGADWQLAWRFPDDAASAEPYLNTPHMGEFLVDPVTKRPWILYNHSRGTADDWGSYDDQGATFGALIPGATLADPPTYLLDARVFPGTDLESHFSRDTDMMPDGSLLLYDSGCENPWGYYKNSYDCPYPGRIFHVKSYLDLEARTTKPGSYTPDLSLMNVYDVPDSDVLGVYECGLSTFFEGELLLSSQLGTTLQAASRAARKPCPRR